MTKSKIYILLIRTIFPLLIFTPGLYAQEGSGDNPIIKDSIVSSAQESSHSIYTSIGYGNNMVLGSTVSQDQPFYFGGITYGFKNELFASVSAFHLNNFDPSIAFYTLSLNYSHVFNSWFDISLGASSYQVAGELADTLFNNFLYGDLTLGFDWRLLYSKLSLSGLFSELGNPYLNLRNSRYFQTSDFFNGKVNVSFDPYANLLFGKLSKTVSSDGTTTYGITTPSHSISGNSKPGGQGGSSGTTETTTTFFGLTEVDFGLPIAFNANKLTLEIEPGFVIPVVTDSSIKSSEGFVLLVSLSFKIF